MPYLVVHNEDTYNRVKLAGFDAFNAGKRAEHNPHGHRMSLCSITLAAAWYQGWLLAQLGKVRPVLVEEKTEKVFA